MNDMFPLQERTLFEALDTDGSGWISVQALRWMDVDVRISYSYTVSCTNIYIYIYIYMYIHRERERERERYIDKQLTPLTNTMHRQQ